MTECDKVDSSQAITAIYREIPALAGVNTYHHPQGQFIYLEEGVLSVITKTGRYFVPPKQGIFIPANIEHELSAKTAVKLTIISISSDEALSLGKSIQVKLVDILLSSLLLESKNISTGYQWDSSDGRTLRLLRDKVCHAELLDTFLPYPQDEKLLNITGKLLKHPSLKSDLISWGKFVKVSSRTLTRKFKKETGITYSEWRQRLNVQIAIKHLAMGDSINSIAKLLGYESSSAFIFMFKKQMSVSPNQFLKINS